MIVYNLVTYLKQEFPLKDFVVDEWEEYTETDSILLKETPGEQLHWFPRKEYYIQVTSRSINKPDGKLVAEDIFNKIRNRFGLVLPGMTVSGVVIPDVITAQITPMQTPGHIGVDDNKRHLYAFNVKIVVGG